MLNVKEIKDIKLYIENIGKHYNVPFLDDYVQEVFLGLYNKGETFIIELKANDKLYHYIYKICVYQLLSVNSPYYRAYILPNTFNDLTGLETYKGLKSVGASDLGASAGAGAAGGAVAGDTDFRLSV